MCLFHMASFFASLKQTVTGQRAPPQDEQLKAYSAKVTAFRDGASVKRERCIIQGAKHHNLALAFAKQAQQTSNTKYAVAAKEQLGLENKQTTEAKTYADMIRVAQAICNTVDRQDTTQELSGLLEQLKTLQTSGVVNIDSEVLADRLQVASTTVRESDNQQRNIARASMGGPVDEAELSIDLAGLFAELNGPPVIAAAVPTNTVPSLSSSSFSDQMAPFTVSAPGAPSSGVPQSMTDDQMIALMKSQAL